MTEHLPGEHLRHAYESIRAQATGLVGPEPRPARGLALLLRSGLAGWMQACRSLVATPAVEALPPEERQVKRKRSSHAVPERVARENGKARKRDRAPPVRTLP